MPGRREGYGDRSLGAESPGKTKTNKKKNPNPGSVRDPDSSKQREMRKTPDISWSLLCTSAYTYIHIHKHDNLAYDLHGLDTIKLTQT